MSLDIKKLFQFTGHSGAIYTATINDKGKFLFTGGADKVVAMWSLDDFTPQKFAIKTDNSIYSLLYLKTLNHLLIGTSIGGIHVIDLNQKAEIRHLKLHDKPLFSLTATSTEDRIVAACADGSISIWNSGEYSLAFQSHVTHEKVRQVAIDATNDKLALACGDGRVVVVSLLDFITLADFKAHELGTNAVCFHPTKPILVTGGKDAYLKFWNTKNFSLQPYSVAAHNYPIYGIGFNASASKLATCSRDKTVKIWDATTFDLLQRLDRKSAAGHLNSVNCLVWANENKLVTAGDDRSAIVWEIA